MHKWMNEWMNEWINEWMNERKKNQLNYCSTDSMNDWLQDCRARILTSSKGSWGCSGGKFPTIYTHEPNLVLTAMVRERERESLLMVCTIRVLASLNRGRRRIITIEDRVWTVLTTIWHDNDVEDEEDVKSGEGMVRTHKYITKAINIKYNKDAILHNDNTSGESYLFGPHCQILNC